MQVLSEDEFLSPHGIRALSRYHQKNPFILPVDGQDYRVDYEPAESKSGLFGGNSNWRGPVWFPANFLLIESLQKFNHWSEARAAEAKALADYCKACGAQALVLVAASNRSRHG